MARAHELRARFPFRCSESFCNSLQQIASSALLSTNKMMKPGQLISLGRKVNVLSANSARSVVSSLPDYALAHFSLPCLPSPRPIPLSLAR
eukprot:1578186-Rhodomonas_salina.1